MDAKELSVDALKYKAYLLDFVTDYGPKLIGAFAVLIIRPRNGKIQYR